MKKLIISALFICGFLSYGCTQNVNLDWAIGFGENSSDYAMDLVVDDNGNTYSTGYFEGTVDFDPSAGIANISSNGDDDIFIAKYDSLGNYLWAIALGGNDNDRGYSIEVDNSSNVYITGSIQGTADFDPTVGTANLSSNGSNDIFLAKYDFAGNYAWAISIGASSGDVGTSLDLDSSRNVYITGKFEENVDFDPGAGSNILSSNGDTDIFIAKYDENGNHLWAKGFGGPDDDGGYSMAISQSGNIHLAGYFQATTDFDPGAGTSNLISTGGKDIFFSKYDENGNYLWAKSIEGTNGSLGAHIAVDNIGNSFLSGSFSTTIDADPSSGTADLNDVGGHDIYLAKYNTNGDYLWAFSIGGTAIDHCNALSIDDNGNPFITGYYNLTMDFDPGADTSNLTAIGNSDIYIAKYTSNGDYVWSKTLGGSNYESGYGLDVDANNNVYVSGYYGGTVDFNPGVGTFNLTSNGSYDGYIAKLGAENCSPSSGTDVLTACYSLTWIDGNTYYSSNNTATYSLINAVGCDSIVTLDLTIDIDSQGCTDSTACNFDSFALCDDGSCIIPDGCTDSTACNYNSTAQCDDGSCIIPDGCTDSTACNYNSTAQCDDGSCILPDGCTDSTACNYNSTAQCDDGSCILPDGCTDSTACNYNSTAQCDDGTCILPDGCTDSTACNYNSTAQCDDGTCILPDGCTDSTACNYNSTAQCDDGSCILPDGCTDSTACNYNSIAQCDDDSCEYSSCAGCIDSNACNYDSEASIEDSSCTYPPCPGCDGDLDDDGEVGTGDLLELLANMGCFNPPGPCTGDLNLDGIVNTADLLYLLSYYGQNCPE